MNRKWIVAIAAFVILAGAILVWQLSAKPEQSPIPPAVEGKAMVNIDGIIDEVGADGKSFRIGELWVKVDENTAYGITGPNALPADEQLVSKEFVVGNAVSGYTEDDVASGSVYALRIYNNFAPQAAAE